MVTTILSILTQAKYIFLNSTVKSWIVEEGEGKTYIYTKYREIPNKWKRKAMEEKNEN